MVIASDAHSPQDILEPDDLRRVGLGAGLTEEELEEVFGQMEELARRCLGL